MIKIEYITYNKETYAIIVRHNNQFKKKGVNFVSKSNDLLQLGFLNHSKNHQIRPHIHKKRERLIDYCTEVLIVKEGSIKVFFYNYKKKNINKSKILKKNDLIILFKGGHGFQVLKNTKIIEIKQGPYLKVSDKKIINEKDYTS